jgi:hypothetical protein
MLKAHLYDLSAVARRLGLGHEAGCPGDDAVEGLPCCDDKRVFKPAPTLSVDAISPHGQSLRPGAEHADVHVVTLAVAGHDAEPGWHVVRPRGALAEKCRVLHPNPSLHI